MSITIRTVERNDIPQIISIWNKSLQLDAITIDTFESKILLDENFDPETLLVAVQNNQLVGFVVGMYACRIPLGDHDPDAKRSWITAFAVLRDFRRMGIGNKLITTVFDTFRSRGKSECFISSYPPGYFTPGIDEKEYAQAVSFLKSLGFVEDSRPLSMDASIVHFKIKPKIIEKEEQLKAGGIVIRSYQRQDIIPFLRFMETEMPYDWLRIARKNLCDLARGLFSSDQIFVVTKDDAIIGYCQYEGSHFGPFGVAKEYQGRGIGTVLLARTVERMRMRGLHNAWVMWTDDKAAHVYAKLGFTETRRFVIFKKILR